MAIWCSASGTVLPWSALFALSRIGVDQGREIHIPDDSDGLTGRYDGYGGRENQEALALFLVLASLLRNLVPRWLRPVGRALVGGYRSGPPTRAGGRGGAALGGVLHQRVLSA